MELRLHFLECRTLISCYGNKQLEGSKYLRSGRVTAVTSHLSDSCREMFIHSIPLFIKHSCNTWILYYPESFLQRRDSTSLLHTTKGNSADGIVLCRNRLSPVSWPIAVRVFSKREAKRKKSTSELGHLGPLCTYLQIKDIWKFHTPTDILDRITGFLDFFHRPVF
jgi:hypothetical protein